MELHPRTYLTLVMHSSSLSFWTVYILILIVNDKSNIYLILLCCTCGTNITMCFMIIVLGINQKLIPIPLLEEKHAMEGSIISRFYFIPASLYLDCTVPGTILRFCIFDILCS